MRVRKSRLLHKILPRPVAFVLSAGTSLGSVQVGMLKAVLEFGIEPDLLVGTSAGAINAIYIGHGFTKARLKQLSEIWTDLSARDVFGRPGLRNFLNLLNGHGALASPKGLRRILQAHLPESHSGLEIQSSVVATDLLTGQPVMLAEGDPRLNVMASAAIPMIFPPVIIDNRHLVDGGVAAYVPLAQAEELGAKTLVVFDAGYPCKLPRLPQSAIERALHFITLMLQRQSLRLLTGVGRNTTVLYLPAPCPLDVPVYDFSQASRLIAAGFESALAFLSELALGEPGIYGHPHVHNGHT